MDRRARPSDRASVVIFVLIVVLVAVVRVLTEVERLGFVLDRVHPLFDLIGGGCARDETLFLLVLREHLDLAGEQALLRVRAKLDLAFATHREARFADESRVLVGLADDELDGVAFPGRYPSLVAVAAAHG